MSDNGQKKKKINASLISSIIAIIIGIVFIIFPNFITVGACYFIAGCLFIFGITSIVSFFRSNAFQGLNFTIGAFSICSGVLICIRPEKLIGLFGYVLGFALLVFGFLRMQQFFELLHMKKKSCWFALVFSVIIIAIGILSLFAPTDLSEIINRLLGIGFVIVGASNFIFEIMLKKAKKETHETIEIE